ncbi:HAD family hydrolase [Alteromonas halophila]|uniref:Haloacid dehalogenase n=1 Tax=Alteromonas halophila TaxID=516698 RepID=A0A918N185_9ALTE|nr:HAD-IA family hydrolase [Alteromonas halophila]GGW93251.1 haloacid dehalogenase [Alteromonas halophila]
MSGTDHIIFDCDGVLIDSEVLSLQVWQELLARHAITLDADYFSQHFLGRSFEYVKHRVKQDFALDVSPELAAAFAERLKEVFTSELTVTPFLLDVLPNLAVPYSLATSSSPERTRNALAVTGLDAFFGDDQVFTSSLVKHGKPAPDLFLYVAATRDLAPENCLVIEDSKPGLQAAQRANMQWLHYTGGSHLHGIKSDDSQSLSDWREFARAFPHLLNSTD